ncbi:MAG: hypothetical protein ABIR29_05005 [Chthoniobacterales bacterium]
MKTKTITEKGSVLMTAVFTITILTMICATSLYVTTQNANATTQTASWQQALAGAEGAVDQGMSALNSQTWTGWYTAAKPLPAGKPNSINPIPASGPPATGSYNYYFPSTLATSSPAGTLDESGKTVASWVTVDTAGLPIKSGYQEYRIRATGVVGAPGPARVSNQKLDNQLRKISLRFDRFSGTAVSTPQAARRIEVIATPVTNSQFPRAVTMENWISMNGTSSIVDSFDSGSNLYSNNGQYVFSKHKSNGDVGLVLSSKGNNVSNLKDNAIYGSLQYSGPAVKKTTGVKGTVSSPFNTKLAPAADPTGTFTSYSSNINNNTVVASGTSAANPTRLKITGNNGNFSLQQNFNITGPTPPPGQPAQDTYLEIWVPGNYNVTGNALITQGAKVHVTWYVDGSISVAGNGYANQSGLAANVSFFAIGSGSITLSGNGDFIGTFYGPLRDVAFTGNGSLIGAVIGDNLTIGSNASIHYDEALGTGGAVTFSNYAYASWFEDNSDPQRNMVY